jgi:hypothetical protein
MQVDASIMQQIASDPWQTHYYQVSDYSTIYKALANLASASCAVAQGDQPAVGAPTTPTTTLAPGKKFHDNLSSHCCIIPTRDRRSVERDEAVRVRRPSCIFTTRFCKRQAFQRHAVEANVPTTGDVWRPEKFIASAGRAPTVEKVSAY